ncbi:MAG: sigma-70 family RNA polymerase sigma factor [Saprospiraceae bacterium]|nr:sigma-70 family RNA polymerase sigma factor [Saprospiraceae bacterium]
MTLRDFIFFHESDQRLCLEQTYRANRNICTNWIKKNYKFDHEKVMDIYIDSLIVLSDMAGKNKILLTNTLVSSYLLGICRNLALSSIRKKQMNTIDVTALPEVANDEYELPDYGNPEQLQRLADAIKQLGEPCSTIINEFYLHNQNYEKISEMLGYQNVNVTKTMKYKCLQRLKKIFFKEN